MVVSGLYRYTRNPMILGIFTMLLGEAVALHSVAVACWLGLFVTAKPIYIRYDEEPMLRKRFGEDYACLASEGVWRAGSARIADAVDRGGVLP
jgi:protein-S-isoprenylcysteine O-methyltransferase Ste14